MVDKVKIENLSFQYKEQEPYVLKELSLSLEEQSFNILYGPSGCGKSTLLRVMAGVYPEFAGQVTNGSVRIDGETIEDLNQLNNLRDVALLFQNPRQQFSMDSVENEFIFTLENLRFQPQEIEEAIEQACSKLKIKDLRNRKIDTLSGGELQKVALGITVARGASLILLDEPFANVDPQSRLMLIDLLKQLQQEDHKTILITDHDLYGYDGICDQIYVFNNGKVDTSKNAKQLFENLKKRDLGRFKYPGGSESTILKLHDVSIRQADRVLLLPENLKIYMGKLILLTGSNGSGKSTFFKALVRLFKCQGKIEYDGQDIKKIKLKRYIQKIGLAFQNPEDQFLKLTVSEELQLSLEHAKYPEYWSTFFLDEQLEKIGLDQYQDHIVYQLSGGQQKKLQILEMLILGNPVLLMDEPLAGLDRESIRCVMELIQEVTAYQEQTLIMISHQLTGITEYFDFHLLFDKKTITYTEDLNG